MIRKISILLVVFMFIIPLIASCNVGETKTTTASNSETQSPDGHPLPESLDFDKDTVYILHWNDMNIRPEFFSEELSGNTVLDQIYYRNIAVEEYLNVKLHFEGTTGMDKQSYLAKAQNSIASGLGEYDIFATYSMTLATLALRECTYNLLDPEIEYLNFDNPWWPESLIETVTIDDKLYFASGDISTNLIYMMHGMFFNKDMMDRFSMEYPYELVLEGKWTLDKMLDMTKDVYIDLNDNNKDKNDQFGLLAHRDSIEGFIPASGMLTVRKDDDGIPVISSDMDSEKMVDVVTRLAAAFSTNDVYTSSNIDIRNIFSEDRALFITDRIFVAETNFSSSDVKYGIVPNPKYDENQEKYGTLLGHPHTQYAISIDSRQVDAASAVLECLGYEGYQRVTPALFDITMKSRYADNEIDAQMFDIIRENVSFDLGRLFSDAFNGQLGVLFRTSIINNNPNWKSTWDANKPLMQIIMTSLVDTIINN